MTDDPVYEAKERLRLALMDAERAVEKREEELKAAKAEIRRLRRALAVLEGRPLHPGGSGRPKGSENRHGTRAQIRRLLPTRDDWSPTELHGALLEGDYDVTVHAVTAALASLERDGDAARIATGRWVGPMDREASR